MAFAQAEFGGICDEASGRLTKSGVCWLFELLEASLAGPNDCEVVHPYFELIGVHQVFPQLVKELRRDLFDIGALFANDMLVGVIGQVVHSPAVAEVDVINDAKVFQRIKGSIHRGEVNFR